MKQTTRVWVETSDIEIGSVELKDGSSDTRAIINPANTSRASTDAVLLTQNIDANWRGLTVNAGGGLNVSLINTLVTVAYDYIWATYPTTSSEVYTFKTGWSWGTTVATITVTYTDSTKEVLSSVAKT